MISLKYVHLFIVENGEWKRSPWNTKGQEGEGVPRSLQALGSHATISPDVEKPCHNLPWHFKPLQNPKRSAAIHFLLEMVDR